MCLDDVYVFVYQRNFFFRGCFILDMQMVSVIQTEISLQILQKYVKQASLSIKGIVQQKLRWVQNSALVLTNNLGSSGRKTFVQNPRRWPFKIKKECPVPQH
jgi:hypothetical protein